MAVNMKVVMLAIAGVCGLGAFYGTTRFLKKETNQVQMVGVLVAVRNLKAEEVITPELFKVVKMDSVAVPPGAIEDPEDALGRWVQVPMLQDEPLSDKKLAEKGSPPGITSKIPKGMQAYTVDVTEQTGVSGFILPEHRVDVFHSMMRGIGQVEAIPILQDVLVLASGTTFTRPEDRSLQSRTVTLAVTPEQVSILAAAKVSGFLSLSLRGVNDHQQYEYKSKAPPVEEKPEVVVQAPPPPPPPAPPPPPPAVKLQFVVVHKGIDNMSRVQVGQVDGDGEAEGDGVSGFAGPEAGKEPPSENQPSSIAGSFPNPNKP